MAIFELLPTGTTGTNNWTCSTGSDFVDIVDEDGGERENHDYLNEADAEESNAMEEFEEMLRSIDPSDIDEEGEVPF